MIPNGYECLACGESFDEQPNDLVCPVCFEDSVVSANYAQTVNDIYGDNDDEWYEDRAN